MKNEMYLKKEMLKLQPGGGDEDDTGDDGGTNGEGG